MLFPVLVCNKIDTQSFVTANLHVARCGVSDILIRWRDKPLYEYELIHIISSYQINRLRK